MKGIIESEYHHHDNNGIVWVFICGEDGNTYFGHCSNFTRKSKHYKKGRTVTFDAEDNGHSHPNAVNIDVELPENAFKPRDELISIQHLPDGAYIKRIRKPDGTELSLIIRDGVLHISCLSEYERDMVWMYQRGPSGRAGA